MTKRRKGKVVSFEYLDSRIYLRPTFMEQKLLDGYWRRATKASIKKAFSRYTDIIGKYKGGGKYIWRAGVAVGTLRIGCVLFTPKQTELIRKWCGAPLRGKKA